MAKYSNHRGRGFIGSNLARYILDKGHKVAVVDNFAPASRGTSPTSAIGSPSSRRHPRSQDDGLRGGRLRGHLPRGGAGIGAAER